MVEQIASAIKELDVVVIMQDITEHSLISGDVGTVVHCYDGGEAYEIEVVAANGHTVALMTLPASSVRLKKSWDVSHVREHSPVRAGDEIGGDYTPRKKNETPTVSRNS